MRYYIGMSEEGAAAKPKIGKVIVKRDTCIGAAVCEALAPGTFEMDSENIAVVKPQEGWDGYGAIMDAAKACPVLAIEVFDENGKKLYPKED